MGVKRYELEPADQYECNEYGCQAKIVESTEGDYVLYSDFQKRDELVRELVEALSAFQDAMRKGSDPRPDLLALVNALYMTDAAIAKAKAIVEEEK